jgi:hypothetical protein
MRPRSRLLAAVAAVAAMTGMAGCGGDETREPSAAADRVEAPPDAEAVALRAELASLLEQHVFLIAHAVRTGERVGFASELYAAAKDELEQSTETLADKLSPLFVDTERERFRERFAELVDLVLGYGREQVRPGVSPTPFREEITQVRADVEELLDDSSRALSPRDLDDHLELTLDELLLALDRLGRDARGQIAYASSAATRSRGVAAVLAVAVAEESPELEQSPVSEPARLYADLRTLLEEEVHLSFAAVQVGLLEGFDSPLFRTSSLQVDESAKVFADRIATIPEVGTGTVELPEVDDPAEEEVDDSADADFTRSEVPDVVRNALRRHWQALELYAREVAADVPDLTKAEIEERLSAATTILADVLADQTTLVRETLLEPLEAADKALLEAIEALTERDPTAYAKLAESLEHVADAADVLTDGVIRVQPER